MSDDSVKPLRIAMWSGPRNISSAMMRAWGSRSDTFVCDEPLYAHYLLETGLPHPGREEVIRENETDWRAIVNWLTGAVPQGKRIFYQKHMAHHLLPSIERDWLDRLTHAFLIREPEEMLTSLIKVIPEPALEDTGLPQQWELLDRVAQRKGRTPPVVDARDVLENPRVLLEKLCQALGVEFMEVMLHWPPGPRPTDGNWAKYWYGAVEQSTGFRPYQPKDEHVPNRLLGLLEEAQEIYLRLRRYSLRAD